MAGKQPSRPKGPGVGRDSGSGRFVTKDYVKTHPKTTEIEHYSKKKGK